MAGHWWCYIMYKCFKPAACGDNSFQLSISAEPIHTASYFKPLSEYKTWIPVPLFHLNMARCQSGSLLLPLTSVFCTIEAHVPYSSLFRKNWEKRVTSSLRISSRFFQVHIIHCLRYLRFGKEKYKCVLNLYNKLTVKQFKIHVSSTGNETILFALMYVHLYIYLNSLLVLKCVDISRKFWKKIHKKARQKDQICLKKITDVSSLGGGGEIPRVVIMLFDKICPNSSL